MSDFVRKPLMQQLNKDNPITRIEKLESGDTVKTSAVINDISQLSSNLGEMAAGKINFYNPTTGQLVGYLTSIPDPAYPNYYMVALDSAGNVQFSVDPSTSGATTMGNGAVSITESGIVIANTKSIYFVTGSGGTGTYITSTTDNIIYALQNEVGGYWRFLERLTGGTSASLYWREDALNANVSHLVVGGGTAGGKISIDGSMIIWAQKDGTETVFNEDSYDIDFRVEGATNINLFTLDAGLDAIGIGKAATSDNLMDVNGSINLVTGSSYKINGTSVLSATTATWTPTWTNLSVGNGTVTAKYQQIGNTVSYHLELVFGTTTSVTGIIDFSPPVTQGTYGAVSAPVGMCRFVAGGAAYQGVAVAVSTTAFRPAPYVTSATYATLAATSSTVPGTWTTGDIIQVNGSYFI